MAEDQSWGEDLAELRRQLDRAAGASHRVADWVRVQLGTSDLPPGIVELVEEVGRAQSMMTRLSERLHSGPLDLLFAGQLMSRESYYLLVSLGVLNGGTYTGDSYSDFQMLHYEDDKRRSYICLDERPPVGRARIPTGLWPEEISWERLRPEQRKFVERHVPEVAARFRRDA